MIISSVDSRLGYANAMKAFQEKNIPIKKTDLSPSYLRCEVPITSQQTAYEVPITVIQQNPGVTGLFPTEKRLEMQDSFFVIQMGYFLMVPRAGGYTGLQDMLFSFPAWNFQPSFDLERLSAFWNAEMRLTVNNDVILPQWDLNRHYYAPQDQRPALLGSSATTFPWQFTNTQDGAQDGFYPMEPNPVLIGSRNNQMTITYPRPFDSTIIYPGDTQIRAVFIFRGILAQNSTPVR